MSRVEEHKYFHQTVCSFCYLSYDDERDLNDHLVDSSACYNYTVATATDVEEPTTIKKETPDDSSHDDFIANPPVDVVVKTEPKHKNLKTEQNDMGSIKIKDVKTLKPRKSAPTTVKSPEKPTPKPVSAPAKKKSTFDCTVKDCNSRYLVQEGLDAHMEREHPTESKKVEEKPQEKQETKPKYTPRRRSSTFDCQIPKCNSRYLEQIGLDDHMKREHNPDGSFKENPEKLPPSTYQNRRRTTTYDCQTPGCNSRYLEQSGLDAHNERGHYEDGRAKTPPPSAFPSRRRSTTYDCQVKDCHSRYLVQSGLDAHYVKEHPDWKPEDKEKSGEGFTKPAYVPRRRTVTYDCQVKDCNSRYLVEEGLEKHMKNDHNEDGSLKELPKKPAYQPRKRTSTFDCQIKDCNSRYLEQSGLDDHMKREHNPDGSFKENPEKLPPPAYRYRRRSSTFDCQIKDCNSRYLEQVGLDDHMKREHNPDGSFKENPEKLPESSYHYRRRTSTFDCQVKNCNSRYLEKVGLDQHMERGHYDDGRPKTPPPSMFNRRKRNKTFDCKEKDCNSRYLVQSGLDDHMKKEHPKESETEEKDENSKENDENVKDKEDNTTDKDENEKDKDLMAFKDLPLNDDDECNSDKKNNNTEESKSKRLKKEATYVCILCTSRFTDQKELESHHDKKHPNQTSFLSDAPVDVTGLM